METLESRPQDEQGIVRALATSLGCEPAALWHVLPARQRRRVEADRLVELSLPWGHHDDDLRALGPPRGDLALGPSASLQALTLGGLELSSLTLAGLPSLVALSLTSGPLSSLDVRGAPEVEWLSWRGATPGEILHAAARGPRYARIQDGDDGVARLLPPGDRLLALDWSGDLGDGALSLAGHRRLVALEVSEASLGSLDLDGCAALGEVSLSELRGLRSLTLPASVRSLKLAELADLEALDIAACEGLSDLEVSGCKRLRRLVCTRAQVGVVKGLQRKALARVLVDAPRMTRGAPEPAPGPAPAPPASRLDWVDSAWLRVTARWLDGLPEADAGEAAGQVGRALTARRERTGRELGFGANLGVDGGGADGWAARVASGQGDPRWPLVVRLGVSSPRGWTRLRRLGQKKALGRVREIDLREIDLRGGALAPLLGCDSLDALSLGGSSASSGKPRPVLDRAGVETLAKVVERGRSLRSLWVSEVDAFEGWFEGLSVVEHPGLESLWLLDCGIDARSLGRACAAWRLGAPRKLTLQAMEIGDVGLEALAGCEALQGMEVLSMTWCGVTARGLGALARSSWLEGLRSLDLGEHGLGPAGFEELARLPSGRLRVLRCAGNRPTAGALRSLLEAPWASGLRELDVSDWQAPLDDEGARLLARSEALGGLIRLSVGALDGLSSRAREALVERFGGVLEGSSAHT